MKARGFWQLGELSDERLVAGLRELLMVEGRNEARIVAHLAEVDDRRIHLKGAFPSLFEYCQKQLGLSDCQAYFRITAARVAQKFPVVYELLERRQIHLTNIAPLAKRLTAENHLELLGAAGRLSKRELLRWLACRYPQPEVASNLRKLPARELVPKPGAVSAGPTGSLEPRSEGYYRLQLNLPERLKEKLELARDLMSHANPSGDLVAVVERGVDLLLARLHKQRFAQTARPRRPPRSSARPPATKPTESDASEAHFTPETSEPRATPERAEAHVTSETSESRVTLQTAKPHVTSDASEPRVTPEVNSAKQVEQASPCQHLDRSKLQPRARSRVRSELLRQLVARDGLCCSYVSEDGVRCTARAFLEIDHQEPWARGGRDTLDNLRLLCRAHNQMAAEEHFGKLHAQGAIAERQVRSARHSSQ
jgi:hypothetical protein